MPFEIVRNDITRMRVDAIVNTANPQPVVGPGTDSAIHESAGPKLLKARLKIGDIQPGHAAATPAFNLSAKYVIHAVSPEWNGGGCNEESTLRQTYNSALALADKLHCASVAFPLLSAGSLGFPKDRALSVAVGAFSDFLLSHEMQIYLVVFNTEAFELSKGLLSEVKSYIDEHYVEERYPSADMSRRSYNRPFPPRSRFDAPCAAAGEALPMSAPHPTAAKEEPEGRLHVSLEERLKQINETFTQAMLRIISENNWTEPEVYNRIFMDRKTFNKIRNNPHHQPSKRTALQLAVALRLNLDETRDFIGRAGYTLTNTSKFDTVLSYFIEMKNYDINEIDLTLFKFTETTLSNCG